MKLLIIEDEVTLNKTMTGFLTAAGYLCETVSNFNDAVDKIDLYEYDCIVLDIMLPGGSGLELLQYLKTNKKNDGVIIISAKDSLDDKITGLQLGADDYLTKPFHLPELSMRVAAIIRRKKMDGQNVLNINNWLLLDTIAQKVTIQQHEIELTQKEYQLLLFFVVNKNRVLSKSAIAQHLWGDDMDLADHYDFIYTHIKNLRKKILSAGGEDCIRSIYGAGYKMQVD
ncbi:response regulator transcription factor [Hydrotalea sp.]|uniref:response regulator transcription factor n=1 Tax=Hydrotalea sp. TaxID=2881279 RepID=UPI0026269C0F|nr:response regulator transcription factor [Hydrotalea sp.]